MGNQNQGQQPPLDLLGEDHNLFPQVSLYGSAGRTIPAHQADIISPPLTSSVTPVSAQA